MRESIRSGPQWTKWIISWVKYNGRQFDDLAYHSYDIQHQG